MNILSKINPKIFKNKFNFEDRKAESSRNMQKYADRIPCILERSGNNIPLINKTKYLVPKDLTVGQYMYVIRKRLKLESSIGIFLFFKGGILVNCSELMNTCYENYKDDDGFLYINYSGENTFG